MPILFVPRATECMYARFALVYPPNGSNVAFVYLHGRSGNATIVGHILKDMVLLGFSSGGKPFCTREMESLDLMNVMC